MATVGRGADQYTVRFPDGLRDRIKDAAAANNRSMNAEIVATLEKEYPASDFDLGTFITHWSSMLQKTDHADELRSLTRAANHELEVNNSEWRLTCKTKDGRTSVTFERPTPSDDD